METQTWLSHHYKFISAKNITILSVSSDEQQLREKHVKNSSDETASIVIFSAEINL